MQPPRVPPWSELRFTVRLATRWSDEDNLSVVNNAVYATLLEEARYAYFGSLGLLADNRFPFVLLQSTIRFLRPGRGGRAVEVGVCTTRLGGKSFEQAYAIREEGAAVNLCEAEALLVGWDEATRSSAPLAPRFRAAVADREGISPDDRGTGS